MAEKRATRLNVYHTVLDFWVDIQQTVATNEQVLIVLPAEMLFRRKTVTLLCLIRTHRQGDGRRELRESYPQWLSGA